MLVVSCSYSCELVDEESRDMGLLLYSSRGGWSAMDKEAGDPRPATMDPAVGCSMLNMR
jgi:hypothetical protein